ncbi:hypothetical protein EIP91_010754 [Steccherinum ochraceum]|uniref:PSP proline-rich domain-containing protein n=1 Tax=Steccherinum ochraceum TaxID=92696 RepID=A0A4R0RWS8_9APHY|nr:hypothetical protein EIP91_010754 [Steccherinum ochraceum]
MAAALVRRIPRVTLFSSPTCSLCDGAKVILKEARQRHTFELQEVNILEPGQERWYRRYRYWIPAIHLEGKEIAKGRIESKPVLDALQEWHHSQTIQSSQSNTEASESEEKPSTQLYEFFKGSDPTIGLRQFGEARNWRAQRVKWLEEFEPGHIRGNDLRDALGIANGDVGNYVPWLSRIADWGYPPGWVGPRDPRHRVWDLINWDQDTDSEGSDDMDFAIFGESEVHEQLRIPVHRVFTRVNNEEDASLDEHEEFGIGNTEQQVTEDSRSDTLSDSGEISDSKQRWASYPETYFSPTLPVSPFRASIGPQPSAELDVIDEESDMDLSD